MIKTIITAMTILLCIAVGYGDQQPLSIIAIKRNIKPVGQVYIAKEQPQVDQQIETSTAPQPKTDSAAETVQPETKVTSTASGQTSTAQAVPRDNQAKAKQIYNQYCAVCHKSGAAGAPILGDKAAWQPRIKKGLKTLVQNAINGYKLMPPKGTCMNCSDQDIQVTVEYMVEASK